MANNKVVIGAELRVDSAQSERNVGNIRKELRLANQELHNAQNTFGEFSAEAVNAAKRVANLRDQIQDAKSLVDAFNPDKKFAAFGQSVQGIVGGFSALQGVMGLVGVESEEVQKQLLKVQSALALTQGLDAVRDSVQGFKNMATIIKTNVVQAFSTLRNAIITTGIGALAVAIGLIVANWDKIKETVLGVDRAQKNLADTANKHAEAEGKKLDAIEDQENILKLQGKSESDILKMKIAQTDEVITAREQQMQASIELEKSQIAAAERNARILRGVINFLTAPLRFVLKTAAQVGDFLGITKGAAGKVDTITDEANKRITAFFIDPAEVKAEGDAAIEEMKNQITRLKNARAGFVLELRGKAPKTDGEANRLGKLNIDPATDPAVLADRAVKDELLKNADVFTNKVIDLSNISADIQQANAKQTAFTEEQTAQARITAANAIGNAFGALSQLVGQHTAAGKALGIAQATINTWIGVSEVLKAPAVLPEPFNTISKVASIATTVASGIMAVKNIVAVKVPGAGSGGGANISAPSVNSNAPLQPTTGNSVTSLDRNTINQLGNQAVRAFVVENDVTTNQERVRRINRAARIG